MAPSYRNHVGAGHARENGLAGTTTSEPSSATALPDSAALPSRQRSTQRISDNNNPQPAQAASTSITPRFQ